LRALLEQDPQDRRSALDRRYAVLEDVLAGQRDAVVYPAARLGTEVAIRLRSLGVRIVAFGDRDPASHDGQIGGIPVLSAAQVATHHSADVILVSSTMYDSVIREDLESRGCEFVVPVGYLNLRLPDVFKTREYDGAWSAAVDEANRKDIEAAFALLGDVQSRRVFEGKLAYYLGREKTRLDDIRSDATIYFDRSVYNLTDSEAVVDGGAFVGDTLAAFIDRSGSRFRSYAAFEPDPASYERLAVVAARDPARITAIQAGLAEHTSKGRLLSTQGADSRFLEAEESGGDSVPVVSLDDYFASRAAPTLIKMDIEGAETSALQGAVGLLGSVSPLMAVSAYHFPTDLWRIPLLLQAYLPSSRILLRHYTREVDDTVCYAIPAGRRTLPSSNESV
jgi:FkbM family methyltransferase